MAEIHAARGERRQALDVRRCGDRRLARVSRFWRQRWWRLEIVILFGGVVARYVFNHPLVWSDELASILFLWLAMLGAVIAFRRDEHMRMTAAVGSLPAPTRATFDLFATCAALAFLLLIAWPAYEYAQEETFITTPALGLNNAWRAAALPSGIALMAVVRGASRQPRRIAAIDRDCGRRRGRSRRAVLARRDRCSSSSATSIS